MKYEIFVQMGKTVPENVLTKFGPIKNRLLTL